MIHNNLRKIVKQTLGVPASTITGYVDITGYVSTESETQTQAQVSFFSTHNYVNKTYSQIASDSSVPGTQSGDPFACIGNSTDNEPDYTLGEIITDGYTISTLNTKVTNMMCVTTLVNTSNEAIVFDEIGLFIHTAGTWHGSTSRVPVHFLLIKEKLDEPMTLGVGESISITFNMFGDVIIEEA